MNVYASEKTDFIKFKKVFDLFKTLYNVCKMFNADEQLCKFSEYVHYNKMESYLLVNHENEQILLEITYKFWFYIMKIRRDDKDSLEFFTREYVWRYKNIKMPLNQVIKNDIVLLNEKQNE